MTAAKIVPIAKASIRTLRLRDLSPVLKIRINTASQTSAAKRPSMPGELLIPTDYAAFC